ncbi:hypothetical protein TNCV_2348061 [Trichonephila clavipes]|uniref:Uncharacterized protein n=1 Tax=Trichonephila clavipes TaxID=2585209 RepID=A0A8X6SXI4_TRICX|nr:hypothetical protein TNCV_2348061 [Trichonephila clavipes]
MSKCNITYVTDEWMLSIDLSKMSLTTVLHHFNQYASEPVGHSVYLKNTLSKRLSSSTKSPLITKVDHGWAICDYLIVISILLDQQG